MRTGSLSDERRGFPAVETGSGTSNGSGMALLLLGLAAVIGLGASRRFATSRAPR